MATTTLSPYMSLPVPVVGVDAGPQWGTDLNNCLTLLDMHNHASGSGQLITPSGLNVNADLTFQNNNLTNAKTIGFYTQLSDPSTLGALYYKGVDLYFNDGSSNHIRLTQAGAVSGATGTITGLPTGTASASYVAGSGTFVFQSATNTAANLDGQSLLLRNATASSHSLTLSPPGAMGADVAITLPTLPASTQALNITSGGVMGTITYDALGVAMTSTGANAIAATRTRATGTTVAAGGVAISASSGSFTTSSATYVDITNLTVTITTSGRPVHLLCMGNAPALESSFGVLRTTNGATSADIKILRDATDIGQCTITAAADGTTSALVELQVPPSLLQSVDAVGAGTYVYKLQAKLLAGSQFQATNVKLVAYEL